MSLKRAMSFSLSPSCSPEKTQKRTSSSPPSDGAFEFPYFDDLKKYSETFFRGVQVPESMREEIKSLVLSGQFQSKGRDPFPAYMPHDCDFSEVSVEGRKLYVYHGVQTEGDSGKEKCGFSILFAPASEHEGLNKDLCALIFNKCALSNMTAEKFGYAVKVNGETVKCNANCKEALFKSVSAFYSENPYEVLTEMYGAKTVPDLKKASRAAKGFDKKSWDRDSKSVMLKTILSACCDPKSPTSTLISGMVMTARDLSRAYGSSKNGVDICIAESPDFDDNVWGIGLNREETYKQFLELLGEGNGHEIAEMFSDLLDCSGEDGPSKNCFNDKAQNALGECLTVPACLMS